MLENDTIAAISTGFGGGIGIIRISGPESINILSRVFKPKGKKKPESCPRLMIYGYIADNCPKKNFLTGSYGEEPNGENPEQSVIDEVMVCGMKGPNTYTREDTAEIHCHGGPQAMAMVLDLVVQNGARLAQPGELTRRAFLNGRLDLIQAEAVMDIINAKHKLSHRAAVINLQGGLSGCIHRIRNRLLDWIAFFEASIDYPEYETEGNYLTVNGIKRNIQDTLAEMDRLVNRADEGRMIREGIETVILGRPNVGKSSLLNTLLDEERAIVTDIPGTTRDAIIEYANLEGVLLKITDTAGIRQADNIIERIGMDKTRACAAAADLILLVMDSGQPIDPTDISLLEEISGKQAIILLNKNDLPRKLSLDTVKSLSGGCHVLSVSAKYSNGINELAKIIKDLFFSGLLAREDETIITNTRHKTALTQARDSLRLALESMEAGFTEELVSVDLVETVRLLGEITGETVNEDIIERIFQNFCLGK